MDRARLKAYAPAARRDFIQAMKSRSAIFGITSMSIATATVQGDVVIINGRVFPKAVAVRRQRLVDRVEREGFESVMEAMAYTWFNRFVALRFMELHEYMDHGYRVLSHPEGKPVPEILEHAQHLDFPGLRHERLVDLKLEGEDQELYRLLLIAQCNALHQAMPFLFEPIEDETELLLPDNLLHSDSLIRKLVSNLDVEDCESVEVIGWLYQFYISDKKDTVMARKSAVPTEDIPAVTQLFTPHWIVRYLVENSLGRLWLLNRPGSRLREQMPYFVQGEPEVEFLKITKPEEISLLDPAVGSGHMLIYAFDLLYLIYQEEGYDPNEVPALILRHNLFGLDLCPRATQLAGLALVLKAREKSKRFFRPEHIVQPQIIELRDVRFRENELQDYIQTLGLGDLFNHSLLKLLNQFEEAKTFGSLIQPCLDGPGIVFARKTIEAMLIDGQLFLHGTHVKVLRVLEQAQALTQRYQVVVANPPYMGSGGINGKLKVLLEAQYPTSRSDLSTVFIERTIGLVLPKGFSAMVTMHSWMFLASFEYFRSHMLQKNRIVTLAHLGIGAFTSLNSKVVQTVAFSFQTEICSPTNRPICFRLLDGNEDEKDTALQSHQNKFTNLCQEDFGSFPGSLVAYWLSPRIRCLLAGENLGTLGETKRGLQPGDVVAMVRLWWECSSDRTEFSARTRLEAMQSTKCWFKFDNGGPFRKWFGNYTNVVDWENNGFRIKSGRNPIVPSEHLYFKPGLVWSRLTSGFPSFRFHEGGSINGDTSPCFFPTTNETWILGLLNSICTRHMLAALSPTLTFLVSDIIKLPSCEKPDGVEAVVEEAIKIARSDWDNLETSWGFLDQPLIRRGLKDRTLEMTWRNWVTHSSSAIRRMQELETENNQLFIEAYGLEGELQPEVPEDQITLNRADAQKDMTSLISYALGCMMGRYSLDKPGLVYARAGNGEFDPNQYTTFPADADGIVPVTEFAWFKDDAALCFDIFLKTTWPPETLEDNLAWVAENLSTRKDETPRETIRRYFATSFYKDHLQTYKKRPIYWLFSSGKERAFQALVYLHRYHEGTLARMRTEYVIPLHGRIHSRIEQLREELSRATSTAHSKTLQKEMDTLRKQQVELFVFDEKLRHFADSRISLDLDEGVKANYGKFEIGRAHV